MKKLTILISILLIVVLSVLLVACNGVSVKMRGVRIGCYRSETQYKISLSCESFDGTAEYTIKTDKEHAQNIHFDIDVQEGKLTVEVLDSDGNVKAAGVYEAGKPIEGDHYYGLTEYGKHKINVTAEGFKGSYCFDWEREYDYSIPVDDWLEASSIFKAFSR